MATFSVTNTNDAGPGSLRQAILDANATLGPDIVNFTGLTGPSTILLTSASLVITDAVDIQGGGTVTVDAGGQGQVFRIDNNSPSLANVSIDGLTITRGVALGQDYGAGINSSENLTITNSTISSNTAERSGGGISVEAGNLSIINSTVSQNIAVNQFGGGIYADFYTSSVSIVNSTISGNSALAGGGGVAHSGNSVSSISIENSNISGNVGINGGGGINFRDGDLSISNSTISGNIAAQGGGFNNEGTNTSNTSIEQSSISGNSAGDGGGIYVNTGNVSIANSTISGNSATRTDNVFGRVYGYGGGIYSSSSGSLSVVNSTISGNAARTNGGGIFAQTPVFANTGVFIGNSIVATNAFNNDLSGVFTSNGNNLIGNGDGQTAFTNGVNGDIVGTAAAPVDPLLGPLQINGGSTLTQVLLTGSPAIEAGNNALIPMGVTTDQRGMGFDRIVRGTVDIGAFEDQLTPPPPPPPTPPTTPPPTPPTTPPPTPPTTPPPTPPTTPPPTPPTTPPTQMLVNIVEVGLDTQQQLAGLAYNVPEPISVTTRLRENVINLGTEAVFDNLVGFYEIIDTNGGIDTNGDGIADLTPGQDGYAEFAITNRVSAWEIRAGSSGDPTLNTTVQQFGDVIIAGDRFYAPFVIANGGQVGFDGFVANELAETSVFNNAAEFVEDRVAYFAYLGANPDGVRHIQALGNNTYGFEDLPSNLGVSDNDFNDAVFSFDFFA